MPSQTALERYKARREGRKVRPLPEAPPPEPAAAVRDPHRRRTRYRRRTAGAGFSWMRVARLVGLLLLVLVPAAWFLLPGAPPPVTVTYELDLESAHEGSLVITLVLEGELAPVTELAYPPGVFGRRGGGVHPYAPLAHELDAAGEAGKSLAIERTEQGWRLETRGVRRAGFIYRVDLARARASEQDIRHFISTPVAGGLRAAGFEIFLEPVGVPVEDITVTLHNPRQLPVLVPWPALVHGGGRANGPPPTLENAQPAHLGAGEGFRPAAGLAPPPITRTEPAAAVPANLFYHPEDLDDLNNALLVCGDIRTGTAQARDCLIQFATDRRWRFSDEAALDLVRRIARTELGFFGSAPSAQITVLLAANEVAGGEAFDVYGVHTGSSVLVLIDPATNYGLLEEHAASVIAHEMFHGWLGEAIPQTIPATLWFTEGATSWYAARMLTAAGIWKPEHARDVLLARLERDYAASPLLGQVPISEAAAAVMEGAETVRFAYAGSTAACMALDQWLAEATGMQRPLDLVLRHLYDERRDVPLTRAGLESAVLAVTGVPCGPWLDAHVYGKTALPPVDRLI